MKTEIEINYVIDAVVETANAMCNPDTWRFDWDVLEPGNIVLNCRRTDGFRCVSDVEDALGYCSDCASVVEKFLQKHDSDKWYCHSESNVWTEGGDGDFYHENDDEAKLVTCVQCQFFND